MLLARDKSQLLIVDVQDKLLGSDLRQGSRGRPLHPPGARGEACSTFRSPSRSNIRKVSDLPSSRSATRSPMPAFVARQGRVLLPAGTSCLRERLHELRRQGRPQVVIGGIEAHVCVLQTAIDLEAQGFEAFVVADAIGSRSKDEPQACAGAPDQGRRRRRRQRDGAVRMARARRHAGVQGAAGADQIAPPAVRGDTRSRIRFPQ